MLFNPLLVASRPYRDRQCEVYNKYLLLNSATSFDDAEVFSLTGTAEQSGVSLRGIQSTFPLEMRSLN